jgi:hypothetical protein
VNGPSPSTATKRASATTRLCATFIATVSLMTTSARAGGIDSASTAAIATLTTADFIAS